jgi:hypothetical protein
MNNIFIIIAPVLGLFLFVVFLTNTITTYAQQQMPPPSKNTPPHITSQSPSSTASPKAVKIMSPTKGQQIPAGKDLIISGTSIDNATSNCQVSMSVNRVRPYQPANAAGMAGGANDYSKWNFVLTSNYTTIKPGPDNRITAKYTCTDNPAMLSPTYSSVNVTGVMDAASTSASTAATTPTANVLQQKQQAMTTSNNATIISNGNPNKITSQDKPSLTVGSNNTTPIVNSVSAPPHPPHIAPTPTNTQGSGELLYLGISSKSANKGDNTKSAVSHHSSSNDDNSFDTTTKIKTQHTSSSSDKPNKQTSTISNNIAESHHDTKPSSSSKTKTSYSSDKSKNNDKPTKTTSTTTTTSVESHHDTKPSSSSKSTSHSNDNSNNGGGAIDSEFGHSDPLSDALDAMSNTLDHLFG